MIDKLPACSGPVLLSTALMLATLLVAGSKAWAADEDSPDGDPSSVDGRATDPRASEPGRLIVPLSGTATTLRSGNLNVTPVRVDAGMIEIGQTVSLSVTLSHTGNPNADPLALGAATMIGKNADEFTTEFNGFRTLQPGESIDVSLDFTPTISGTKSAGLRLSIDGATAPYVVLIDGSARFPLTSELAVTPGEVTFGQTIVGQSVTREFTLSNTGDEEAPSITITDVVIAGDTPDAFDVDFTPTTLPPGDTLSVSATMSSNGPGNKTADVTVAHDGNNEPIEMTFSGGVIEPTAIPVNFTASDLEVNGLAMKQVTSLQFGPDGKLYFSEMDGPIHILDVERTGKNKYVATHLESIDLIRTVMNHDDNGDENPNLNKRLVTGILVAGSAANPIIYVTSSDPRQGGGPPQASHGPNGNDTNLDTNSGILHRLTKSGNTWSKLDLVRGLPRSEENHAPNGMVLDGNKLLMMSGGHTNKGMPSYNFAGLSEFALSAALLEIDLGQIGNSTYDLPTLDDEDRPGVNDANDPFGGNNGKNQAKLVANGPVSIFATGFRNAYDVTKTASGRLYTFDNGPNTNWGGIPKADCKLELDNGGKKLQDTLHLITRGSYHGHPNPVRGNKANTFNESNPQSPIEVAANPEECEFMPSGDDGSLTSVDASTNGIDEYSTINFGGAMQGDLIAAGFNQDIYRFQLNGNGTAITSKSVLVENVGKTPLDVIALGSGDPFPGTIFIGHLGAKKITVLEPADY